MADAVVNFLVENLLQILSDNVELIRGVDDDFKNLLEEVKSLKAFLDDAAKVQSDSKQWEQLVKEIQKTVHKAEDAIDKFLVQSKLHREKNRVGRFLDEIRCIHEQVKKLRQNNQQSFQPRSVLELPQKVHEVTQFYQLAVLADISGLIDKGSEVFTSMVHTYGIEPTTDHLSYIVDLLGRAGYLDEAEKLVKDRHVDVDSTVWWTLFSSCAAYGNVRLGRIAAGFLLETEKNNPTVYVLLSNIYASAEN
ncbi:hypothetical protein K7X08_035125 [Anisodus acutangulus]|uniref:Disease resistance N-terminal domain-containing protein n=1 Tax=Anisodus acutangulus TaxID=402998 RepID=A0A9Q1LH01_9SOLA|nr:hypothetical protein K7X08_035125 [Anisodus acutangulus]